MPNNNRIRLRNPIARAAILRKGGVHDKTNKAKRQKRKQAFKKEVRAGTFGSFLLC
jgi:hypothetical protein